MLLRRTGVLAVVGAIAIAPIGRGAVASPAGGAEPIPRGTATKCEDCDCLPLDPKNKNTAALQLQFMRLGAIRDQSPGKRVALYISSDLITQTQFQFVMGYNPSTRPTGICVGTAPLPVQCVSWEQAQEFCKRLSPPAGATFRLPRKSDLDRSSRLVGATTGRCPSPASKGSPCVVFQWCEDVYVPDCFEPSLSDPSVRRSHLPLEWNLRVLAESAPSTEAKSPCGCPPPFFMKELGASAIGFRVVEEREERPAN
jgi:hypothetical protein